jgi:flagellar protein FlgJ
MTNALTPPVGISAAPAPSPLATTVKHMTGMLWYEMLSDMNETGLSDESLGTGGSDFQSLFLWNLAQNDFGKYDSKLTDAAIAQLGSGNSAAVSASGGVPIPLRAIPAFTHMAQAALGPAPVMSAQAVTPTDGATADDAALPARALERAKTYAQNLWPEISAAAQALGVSPVAILAQSALETGWGAAAAGNNYFGIKASPGQSGTARPTHEVVGGVLQAQTASFRDYASPEASVADYVGVIQSGFQSAIGQNSIAGFARTLQDHGYATDPGYAAKIVTIAQSPMMQQVLQSLPASSLPVRQTSGATSE